MKTFTIQLTEDQINMIRIALQTSLNNPSMVDTHDAILNEDFMLFQEMVMMVDMIDDALVDPDYDTETLYCFNL